MSREVPGSRSNLQFMGFTPICTRFVQDDRAVQGFYANGTVNANEVIMSFAAVFPK